MLLVSRRLSILGIRRKVNLLARIFCKLVEFVLHIRTLILVGPKVLRDPTWLLVHYQSEAQRKATAKLASDLGLPNFGNLKPGQLKSAVEEYRVNLSPTSPKIRVAVIIPFRDAWKMTLNCIESLLKQNLDYLELTVCLVDNGSQNKDTLKGLQSLEESWHSTAKQSGELKPVLQVIRDNRPFNFSELNNAAVECLCSPSQSSIPEFLLFLNNDTLWEDPQALEKLVHFAKLSPRIGAVGCTLLYRNSKVQHLFLAPGVKLAGAHPCKGISLNISHSWYADPRPVAAITGALLLVATRHFQAAKGFDSALATSCQDLDLCLKLQELGLENWVLPYVSARHFETSTRLKRNQSREITYVSSKWVSKLAMNAYFSREISRWSERPALSWGESAYPWSAVLKIGVS
jgi:GT2 family glycosyltransferase